MQDLALTLATQLGDSIRSATLSEDGDAATFFLHKDGRGSTIRFKNTPVLRLLRYRGSYFLEVKTGFVRDFKLDAFATASKEKGWFLTDYRQSVLDCLIQGAPAVYAKCNIKERIGCCSQYVECSDAGICIKPDVPWAAGCRYRDNLENRRIFYGRNRNTP